MVSIECMPIIGNECLIELPNKNLIALQLSTIQSNSLCMDRVQSNEWMTNSLQQSHTPLHSCRFSVFGFSEMFCLPFCVRTGAPDVRVPAIDKALATVDIFHKFIFKCNLSNTKMRIQRFEQSSEGIHTRTVYEIESRSFCCSRTNQDKCNDTTLAAMELFRFDRMRIRWGKCMRHSMRNGWLMNYNEIKVKGNWEI